MFLRAVLANMPTDWILVFHLVHPLASRIVKGCELVEKTYKVVVEKKSIIVYNKTKRACKRSRQIIVFKLSLAPV